MENNRIVSTGKNEYIVKKLKDIKVISAYACPGSKVYCIETEKMYVYMGENEWVSI